MNDEKKVKKAGRPRKNAKTSPFEASQAEAVFEQVKLNEEVLSGEKTNSVSPKKAGRPAGKVTARQSTKKTPSADIIIGEASAEAEVKTQAKRGTKGRPAKPKSKVAPIAEDIFSKRNVLPEDKNTQVLQNKSVEPEETSQEKTVTNDTAEVETSAQATSDSRKKQSPVAKSRTRRSTATQSAKQSLEDEKRKPGRPSKKTAKEPVLSLEASKRLSLPENEKLALEARSTLSLEQGTDVAIESHGRAALDSVEKLPLEQQEKLLPSVVDNASSQKSTPAKRGRGARKVTPPVDSVDISATAPVEVKAEKSPTANEAKRGGGRRKNTATTRSKKQETVITIDDLSENTENQNVDVQQIDFVSGSFGVSAYQGSESLGGFGEKAALGVLGIIDEAPIVEAVLPLVSSNEQEFDQKHATEESFVSPSEADGADGGESVDNAELKTKNTDTEQVELKSKNNRRSKRGKKAKAEKEANASNSVDAVDIGIVEDGDLARIEAEMSVKKHQKGKKEEQKEQKVEKINRVLYVSAVPDEQVEVVITENGVVSEYFVEMAHQAKIRGNIYKGVINNVDTNLQAAFVNFGGGKNGFLQIDEVHPEYWLTHHTEGSKYPPIQKVLKVGQEVLVQVVKEPSGSKGAFLTTWLSLAGRFIVLTPGQEQIGVSRKVEDNIERARLRELLTNINPGDNMGVIIRTASEGASKTNIQSDLKYLKRSWKEIQKSVVEKTAPSLIYQEADLASRAVRDYLSEDIDEVWVDSEELQTALQDLVHIVFSKRKDVLKVHKDTRYTLWERFNILHQLEEVTKREVNLPSGGRLVFDQTEALMAIDINSGKTQGKSNFESMVFRTNMEAAEAIARHLRLRDIGGQVVIDFIEMRDRNHCREVEKCMRNAMKRDRARHDVGRLSSFGLLELVRQRTGTSAISMSSEPCPHCRGTGFRRNMEWQSQGVLRDIKSKLAGKTNQSHYVHHVDQDVAFYILNKKRDRLSELETKFNVKIEIQAK